jgi:hypothetical protein
MDKRPHLYRPAWRRMDIAPCATLPHRRPCETSHLGNYGNRSVREPVARCPGNTGRTRKLAISIPCGPGIKSHAGRRRSSRRAAASIPPVPGKMPPAGSRDDAQTPRSPCPCAPPAPWTLDALPVISSRCPARLAPRDDSPSRAWLSFDRGDAVTMERWRLVAMPGQVPWSLVPNVSIFPGILLSLSIAYPLTLIPC